MPKDIGIQFAEKNKIGKYGLRFSHGLLKLAKFMNLKRIFLVVTVFGYPEMARNKSSCKSKDRIACIVFHEDCPASRLNNSRQHLGKTIKRLDMMKNELPHHKIEMLTKLVYLHCVGCSRSYSVTHAMSFSHRFGKGCCLLAKIHGRHPSAFQGKKDGKLTIPAPQVQYFEIDRIANFGQQTLEEYIYL